MLHCSVKMTKKAKSYFISPITKLRIRGRVTQMLCLLSFIFVSPREKDNHYFLCRAQRHIGDTRKITRARLNSCSYLISGEQYSKITIKMTNEMKMMIFDKPFSAWNFDQILCIVRITVLNYCTNYYLPFHSKPNVTILKNKHT